MKLGQRSVFDLTHERKLSCDMGKLVPMMYQEVLPGDTFKVNTDMLVRIAPMLSPVMHRITAYTHFYFVPTRLLWTNWEKFITGGEDGKNASVVPTVTSPGGGYAAGTLWDYFGLPTGIAGIEALAFLFRAYALIYNQWYRNQNLISEVGLSLADGADATTNMSILNRMWEQDYFTGALPFAQRGDAVEVPLGGVVPVNLKSATGTEQLIKKASDHSLMTSGTMGVDGAGGFGVTGVKGVIDPNGTLEADLGSASPITINALRQCFQVQKWMERNARGGARYIESILTHWGIRSSDARLQRPEFLGGGRSPIVISEVLQTSSTDGTSPQGNMAGHGYSAQSGHGFVKSFEEHGYIVGVLSIMPRTAYYQGVNRMWNRRSNKDWAWPEFANLGEQEILNKEIYAGAALPDGVFGYNPRYEEYRREPSTVHGDFRTTLDYWHMARKFTAEPALNAAFVTADPTKRIVAAPSEHVCWIQLLNQVQAARLLPKRGTPGALV